MESLLNGRDIAGLSGAEVFELLNKKEAANSDPLEEARRNHEIQLLLRKLSLPALEQLMDLVVADDRAGHGGDIFANYVIRDSLHALAWASRQPNVAEWRIKAVGAIADSDPDLALEMFQDGVREIGSDRLGGPVWKASCALAEIYARQGTASFFGFLDKMPSRGATNLVSGAVHDMPKEDMPRFVEEVAQRTKEGGIEYYAMGNILRSLSLTDPKLAWSWIEKTESLRERADLEVGFAQALNHQGKADEAMKIVEGAMALEPGKEKEFFMTQATSMMQYNMDLVLRIQELLPPEAEMTKDDVMRLGGRGGGADWIDISRLLSSPDAKAAYLVEAFQNKDRYSKLNDADFQVLASRIHSLGLTVEGKESVQQALSDRREKSKER